MAKKALNINKTNEKDSNHSILETKDILQNYTQLLSKIKLLWPLILVLIYIINYLAEYYFFTKEKISYNLIEFSWQTFAQNTFWILLITFISPIAIYFFNKLLHKSSKMFWVWYCFIIVVIVLTSTINSSSLEPFQTKYIEITIFLLSATCSLQAITYYFLRRKVSIILLILNLVIFIYSILSLQIGSLEQQSYYYLSYQVKGEKHVCRVFRVYDLRIICINSKTPTTSNSLNTNYSQDNSSEINSYSIVNLNQTENNSFIPFEGNHIDSIRVFNLINEHRIKQGLKPLQKDEKLINAALEKSKHMVEHDYFKDTSPEGVKWSNFISDAGYNYISAGENIAIGFTSADNLVNAWMNSSTHRDNILNEEFTSFGMASVNSSTETNRVTMFFAQPAD